MDRERQSMLAEQRETLEAFSRALASSVGRESDRWFLSSLFALDRGVARAEHAVVATARRAFVWRSNKSTKQRVMDLLRKEARRGKAELDAEAFEVFSDRMSTLIELVLSGTIAVSDIGFEAIDVAQDEGDGSDGGPP